MPRASAASLALLVLAPVAGCGARTSITDRGEAKGVCVDPRGDEPTASKPDVPANATKLRVRLRNRCEQTIWPAFGRTGGLDQSVVDADLWTPLEPEEERNVALHVIAVEEVQFWGRTGCVFDAAGQGSCESGDCGHFTCFDDVCSKFVCPFSVGDNPLDATSFDLAHGFGTGANVAMSVEADGCDTASCALDLSTCPAASSSEGECGVAGCADTCPSLSSCCLEQAGCFAGKDLRITFCP